MSKVLVFSKMPTDVRFDTFEQKQGKDGVYMCKVSKSFVVDGLNTFMNKNNLRIRHDGLLACTEVDESMWNAIIAERGQADVLLISKQIFAAKNAKEAEMIVKDASGFITDLKTEKTLNAKPIGKKLI